MENILKPCPHCREEVELKIRCNEAFINCKDHNCLGVMQINWGSRDNGNDFIDKLKEN